MITWSWVGSTVATVALTAFVTAVIVKFVNKRNGNGDGGKSIEDDVVKREHRVMLRKLDEVCACIPLIAQMPALQQRTNEVLGEIKGVLSK